MLYFLRREFSIIRKAMDQVTNRHEFMYLEKLCKLNFHLEFKHRNPKEFIDWIMSTCFDPQLFWQTIIFLTEHELDLFDEDFSTVGNFLIRVLQEEPTVAQVVIVMKCQKSLEITKELLLECMETLR